MRALFLTLMILVGCADLEINVKNTSTSSTFAAQSDLNSLSSVDSQQKSILSDTSALPPPEEFKSIGADALAVDLYGLQTIYSPGTQNTPLIRELIKRGQNTTTTGAANLAFEYYPILAIENEITTNTCGIIKKDSLSANIETTVDSELDISQYSWPTKNLITTNYPLDYFNFNDLNYQPHRSDFNQIPSIHFNFLGGYQKPLNDSLNLDFMNNALYKSNTALEIRASAAPNNQQIFFIDFYGSPDSKAALTRCFIFPGSASTSLSSAIQKFGIPYRHIVTGIVEQSELAHGAQRQRIHYTQIK